MARFPTAVVPQDAAVEVETGTVNGSPALFLDLDGELDSVGTVAAEGGKVREIYLVRNPDKLVDVGTRREVRIL